MGVFVKICGCASQADLEAVVALQPDAVGFILWPGSKRYVDPVAVGHWTRAIPATIAKVGVFVNASADAIRRAVDSAGLTVAQLHGDETPDLLTQLPSGLAVWRAIHLNRPLQGEWLRSEVGAFLLDYHAGSQPGGTGTTVDWNAAAQFVRERTRKVLLAGGLNQDNVTEAIRIVRPWGVDVSSGVEAEPGKKDLEKVKRFIEACRSVD